MTNLGLESRYSGLKNPIFKISFLDTNTQYLRFPIWCHRENLWLERNLPSFILLINPGKIVHWNISRILIYKWWAIKIQRTERERIRIQLFQCPHSPGEKTEATSGTNGLWEAEPTLELGAPTSPGALSTGQVLHSFWEKLTELLLNNEMVQFK